MTNISLERSRSQRFLFRIIVVVIQRVLNGFCVPNIKYNILIKCPIEL